MGSVRPQVGGEGECSQNQHGLDRSSFFFQIPHPGAQSVTYDTLSSFEASGPGWEWIVHFVKDEGVVLELKLPADDGKQHGTSGDPGPFMDGSLVLQWTDKSPNVGSSTGKLVAEPVGEPNRVSVPSPHLADRPPALVKERRFREVEDRNIAMELGERLSPRQRQAVVAELKRRVVAAKLYPVTGRLDIAPASYWKPIRRAGTTPSNYRRLQVDPPLDVLAPLKLPVPRHQWIVRSDEWAKSEQLRLKGLFCRAFRGRIPAILPATKPAFTCSGSAGPSK